MWNFIFPFFIAWFIAGLFIWGIRRDKKVQQGERSVLIARPTKEVVKEVVFGGIPIALVVAIVTFGC